MHGVVVEPLAAPDEAVALEDSDDFARDAVSCARRAPAGWFAAGAAQFVAPVMRLADIDVDGDPEGMGAETVRAGDRSPVVSARRVVEEAMERLGERCEFRNDGSKLAGDTVDASDSDGGSGAAAWPGNRHEPGFYVLLPLAVHAGKERGVANAAGIIGGVGGQRAVTGWIGLHQLGREVWLLEQFGGCA